MWRRGRGGAQVLQEGLVCCVLFPVAEGTAERQEAFTGTRGEHMNVCHLHTEKQHSTTNQMHQLRNTSVWALHLRNMPRGSRNELAARQKAATSGGRLDGRVPCRARRT